MSAAESAAKASIVSKLLAHLRELHAGALDRACAYFVPGRVELAGKHTDYAGGRSLVCAIERGICFVAAPRSDGEIHVRSADTGSEVCFTFEPEMEAVPGEWPNYAITVARRIARDFPMARTGVDIAFSGDLPQASGMSSSSALIVGFFSTLAEINSLQQTDFFRRFVQTSEDLAGYLGAVECGAPFGISSGDRGVGTLGGSEDHVAILCSRAGFARQYSYCPIRFEREVQMPKDYSLVIGVSAVIADKTGRALDAYNRASLAARKILEIWRHATRRDDSSLAAAIESAPAAMRSMREIVSRSTEPGFAATALLSRLAQFAEESNEIVPGFSAALAAGDVRKAGELMDRSQYLAEACLGNQTPETIELARSARSLGAAAASAFGAGFGGSAWALVSSAQAEGFRDAWAARYRDEFPTRAEASEFLITRAGPSVVKFQSPSP